MQGVMRKIGIEGGIWAFISDEGRCHELIDAPAVLKQDGLRVELELMEDRGDVSIGMMGSRTRVRAYTIL